MNMKNIRISIYAMMLLMGVSCVKEEQETIIPPVTENSDVPSFVALGSQVGGSAASKVSLMENGTSVNWQSLTEARTYISSLLKETAPAPSSATSLRARKNACSTNRPRST